MRDWQAVLDLKNRKLYHQLTEKVLQIVRHPYYHQPDGGNNELITYGPL